MCGIIGGGNKYKCLKGLETLEHRGIDSYGAIVCQNNSHTPLKSMELFTPTKTNSNTLEKLLEATSGDGYIMHNRWASIGGINLELAHPITNEQDFSVIHNGTKKSLKEVLSTVVDSDTQAISHLVGKVGLNLLTKMLDGAGVVFVVDKQGRIFFHKDENRPLFINKDRNLFASEPVEAGEWMLIKDQNKIFSNITDFLQNVETTGKIVKVASGNLKIQTSGSNKWNNLTRSWGASEKKCPICSKKHFLNDNGICFVCEAQGKKKPTPTQTTTYYYSGVTYNYKNYPEKVLVEYKDSIYFILTNKGGNTYNLQKVWGSGKKKPKNIFGEQLTPIEVEKVQGLEVFVGDNKWEDPTTKKCKVVDKYTTNPSYYKYRVENKNKALVPYKFVFYKKGMQIRVDGKLITI